MVVFQFRELYYQYIFLRINTDGQMRFESLCLWPYGKLSKNPWQGKRTLCYNDCIPHGNHKRLTIVLGGL